MAKAKIIAFYLPQFHPTPENDKWWGKGFTEWTNVAKAKPMFPGHYQPKIPSDLGFYDLRLPSVREEQARLAEDSGIYGFCYWHYWFGNGKRLLETVFDNVLESGNPNFPFCLAWANHSWYAKTWNKNSKEKDKLLIEQIYPGYEDAKLHFDYLLKAFKDSRYIKINGSPLLVIFNPKDLPYEYIELFQKWAKDSGFKNGLDIVGNITQRSVKRDELLNNGYTAVTYQRLTSNTLSTNNILQKVFYRLSSLIMNKVLCLPRITDYAKATKYLIQPNVDSEIEVIPTIIPNWDHTPRSGKNGSLFINSNPENFKKHVIDALEVVKHKPLEKRLIFLKSWNEWGEGNYLEPDLKFGKRFLESLKEALERI